MTFNAENVEKDTSRLLSYLKTLKISDINEQSKLSDYIKLLESDLHMIKQQYFSIDNKLTGRGFVVE